MARPQLLKIYLRVLWLIALLITAAGSVLPSDSPPIQALGRLPLNDKFEHTIAYAVLAWLPGIHERRRVVVAAAIGAVALGVGLEYVQLYSGWRDFEIGDMVADAAGAGCGLLAAVPVRSARFLRQLQK